MPRKINNKKIIIIIAGIIISILSIVKILDIYYQKQNYSEISYNDVITNEDKETEELDEEKIKVYITGEVKNDGVIELDYGSRISDAIDKAGGLTETANIKEVNLAYELEDGQKIYIPNVNETENKIVDDGNDGIVENEAKENEIININKATSEELQNLDGIGVTLAQNIVDYRKENGKFNNIEELKNVPGIGENKFNNIKENIKIK